MAGVQAALAAYLSFAMRRVYRDRPPPLALRFGATVILFALAVGTTFQLANLRTVLSLG